MQPDIRQLYSMLKGCQNCTGTGITYGRILNEVLISYIELKLKDAIRGHAKYRPLHLILFYNNEYLCMYIVGEGLKRPQHRDHPWSIVLTMNT
jgi:hypothetical protein